MAISRPPPPQKKDSGMGCLGCGCLILVAILLVLVGLAGGLAFFLYKDAVAVTSSAPAAFPPYNGSDDIYASAQKKISDFNQAVGTGNPATLTLSADEINSMLAHDRDLNRMHARYLVELNGDEARLQGSVPTDSIALIAPFIQGRYVNADATFALTFNTDSKTVGLDLHKMQIGDTPVPQNALPTMQVELYPWINMLLQKYPAASNALKAATTVGVKNGQFVIVTK
jgi:hypothetical protein